MSFPANPSDLDAHQGWVYHSSDKAWRRAASAAAAAVERTESAGLRWAAFTTKDWVTFNSSYGPNDKQAENKSGTGAEPDVGWTDQGWIIFQGERLKRFVVKGRSNSNEITALNIRVVHHGAPGGEWNSSGDVVRTTLVSIDDFPITSGFQMYQWDTESDPMPTDGYVLIYIQPVGTLTAKRYIYTQIKAVIA